MCGMVEINWGRDSLPADTSVEAAVQVSSLVPWSYGGGLLLLLGNPSFQMKACFLSALLLMPVLPVLADDILVDSNSDSALRSAIDGANPGDVITFAPALSGQTITLTGGQLVINVNLTIDASGLDERLTVSGGGVTRVFLVNGFHDVLLRGFNVTSGQSPVG